MPGRHRRRERLPFAVFSGAAAVVVAAAVAASSLGRGGDATERPPDSAGVSGIPAVGSGAASSAGVEVPASAGPEGAAREGERKGTLVIHGTGDVSLDPDYIPAFRTQGYRWAWSGLGGLFRDDDLTVINLECPVTDVSAPEAKTFVFRCDPTALPVAKRFGVEVANLANNHAFDHGPEGLLD